MLQENTGLKMLATARNLISHVGNKIGLKTDVIENFIQPDRIVEVKLPVKMDNGELKTFIGYRSQHNNILGPYKGGIRFHEGVSREEVIALSTLMTLKCAVAGLPYGGGKGGVIVDPKTLTVNELEQLSRAYAKALVPFIGEKQDVPAPDVNTNGQIMTWMLDEYEQVIGHKSPSTFTGKPINRGGSLGRTEATGRGGLMTLLALLDKKNIKPENTTVAIQGFGNVGYYFAKLAFEQGLKIVAVSDAKGGIYNAAGLNPEEVITHSQTTGSVINYAGAQTITNQELLALEVTVLVPAALENVINSDNVNNIKTEIIVEMANGPITEEAYVVLDKKNILALPDVLANSGGVIVSYLEWVQGLQGYWWTEAEVNSKLEQLIIKAFNDIYNLASETGMDLKNAAFAVALKRILS